MRGPSPLQAGGTDLRDGISSSRSILGNGPGDRGWRGGGEFRLRKPRSESSIRWASSAKRSFKAGLGETGISLYPRRGLSADGADASLVPAHAVSLRNSFWRLRPLESELPI